MGNTLEALDPTVRNSRAYPTGLHSFAYRAFVSLHPPQAALNSTPQTAAKGRNGPWNPNQSDFVALGNKELVKSVFSFSLNLSVVTGMNIR
jgi:hypothetical protein